MKNTKIMAVLVVLLAAMLFVGAASAAVTQEDLNNITAVPDNTTIAVGGTVTMEFSTTQVPAGDVYISWGDGTALVKNLTWTNNKFELTHTYKAASTTGYQVLVTNATTAVDGTSLIKVLATVQVTDTPGEIVAVVPTTASQYAPVTLTFTSMGVVKPANITVNYGDGQNSGEIEFTAIDGGYKAEDSHPYATTGTFTVTYTLNGKTVTAGTITIAPSEYRYLTNAGQDVFVYEHIDVSKIDDAAAKLTKYSDGASPSAVNVIAGSNGKFYLTEDVVNGEYGKYVIGNAAYDSTDFVYIWYPEISLQAELTTDSNTGATAGDSIDGKTVNKDTMITFLINAPKVGPAFYNADTKTGATAKIVFTTPASGKTTAFGTADFDDVTLTASQTTAEWTRAGEDAAAGAWTAQAEYVSPAAFADYAAKSNTISFTLQSSTLTITAAKDSVIRSNPFTVTISGKAQTVYAVYLEGAVDTDVNPTLQPSQTGFQGYFTTDATNGVNSAVIGGAFFKTDASGKRTIQYNTAEDTEDKTYTIRVSGIDIDSRTGTSAVLDTSDYDKVKVKVEKGAVTMSASGDGSYYIGDEITLSGTNTDSSNVYLFITGPNLKTNGEVLKSLPNHVDAYLATNPVSVKTDNTWEYKWDTSGCGLDTGAYTIYATSAPTNGKASDPAKDASGNTIAVKLSDSEYATVSVNLKQPFLSAVPSGSVIAQGDTLYVRGTAEGNPSTLMLYIFGPNFFDDYTVTVEDDGTYERKIDISSSMSSNQYFVVVQHPMYNGVFDAKLAVSDDEKTKYFYIQNSTTGGQQQGSFVVWGQNKLQGSQAADALTKMIDDANIDDIYTKLTFTVAAPWIRIENPGDQAVGSTFTISGTTNLAVDDQVLVEVMSSSFTAQDKTSTSTTSGVSQTTKVVAGEGTDNVWSVEVDTTNWKLDEYTIKVNGIEVDVSTTTNFNLVEKVVVTPTATATGATPTTTATATATTAPTQTPGFGAFIALAGLGAVALLVLRRN